MSSAWRSAHFAWLASRAAFSWRQTCHLPGKKVERPSSSSSTEVATDSRNQRSCATRMTAASIVESSCSSHSIDAMSRWFVGSSSSSRSGLAGERARERGARQLAAGEGLEAAVEVGVGEAEAAQDGGRVVAPAVAAGVLEPRLRLAVAPQRLGRVVAGGHRLLEPAQLALGLDEVGRARERVLAQREAARRRGGRWSCSATRAPFSQASSPPASSVSPISARSSVVLPAPFGPASASRSRRSTLNETPSKSGVAGELLAERGCDQDRHALRVVPLPRWKRAGVSLSCDDAKIQKLSIDTIRALAMDAVQKANAGHPGHGDGARAARVRALPAACCATTRRTRTGRTATASSSRPATPASSSTPRSTSPATTSRSRS